MGSEASKTRSLWDAKILSLLDGKGIDIGCGNDPIFPDVDRFDQSDGDANQITRHIRKTYDFVFSAHCLEHMQDPRTAAREWFNLVRPGGHMVVIVPDEDLYEQGCFPSAFNPDHKWTFTIAKSRSWSPRSVNVTDLARSLGAELVQVELQDLGYDRALMRHGIGSRARYLGRLFLKCKRAFPKPAMQNLLARCFFRLGAAIDQTAMDGNRLAQIQFILRKPALS